MDNHQQFLNVLAEAANLRKKKFALYGECYNDFGIYGIAIKINDKNSRLRNITRKILNKQSLSREELQGETLRDTAVDLINYAAMFIMEIDNEAREIKNAASKGRDD